jgi:hypothetical protein
MIGGIHDILAGSVISSKATNLSTFSLLHQFVVSSSSFKAGPSGIISFVDQDRDENHWQRLMRF